MTLWMELFVRIGCWATVVMTRGMGTMPISLFWSHPTQPNPTLGRPDTIKMLDYVPIQCNTRLPLQLVLYVLVFLNLCHHQVSNGSLFGVEKPPRCWLPKQLTSKVLSHCFAWCSFYSPKRHRGGQVHHHLNGDTLNIAICAIACPPIISQYCTMCNCMPPIISAANHPLPSWWAADRKWTCGLWNGQLQLWNGRTIVKWNGHTTTAN